MTHLWEAIQLVVTTFVGLLSLLAVSYHRREEKREREIREGQSLSDALNGKPTMGELRSQITALREQSTAVGELKTKVAVLEQRTGEIDRRISDIDRRHDDYDRRRDAYMGLLDEDRRKRDRRQD